VSAVESAQRGVAIPARAPDQALADVFDRYTAGSASTAIPADIAPDLVRLVRRVGPRWAGPIDTPDAARRRLVVATFVLDLIDWRFETAWTPGGEGDLLEWACSLVRETAARPAESVWHLAALAQLERAYAFGLKSLTRLGRDGGLQALSHLAHAEGRFPAEGQWLLARAVDAEISTWPPTMENVASRVRSDIVVRVQTRFRLAASHPAVRDEAHLRLGYFELRRGRADLALAEFDRIGVPEDRVLRYWLHLFRGRSLSGANRLAEAIEAYRRALIEFPQAQAATLGLGTTLVAAGRPLDARDVVTRMLDSEPAHDPWRVYAFPAYRHWPAFLGVLGEAIKP
jgi:hypothetical protein